MTKREIEKSQRDRFIEAAREVGADEDEAAFKAKLAMIARQKVKGNPAKLEEGDPLMYEAPKLDDHDHNALVPFLERVLDGYRQGEIALDDATGGLAQMIAAIDVRNMGEVKAWLHQKGLELFES